MKNRKHGKKSEQETCSELLKKPLEVFLNAFVCDG